MTLKKEENLWNAEEIYDLFSKKIDRDWECNSIAIDSRKVKPGNIFLAMPGTKFDGHEVRAKHSAIFEKTGEYHFGDHPLIWNRAIQRRLA